MPGYISEIDYYGTSAEEFVEVAVPAGTDVSGYTLVFYQSDGTVYNTFGLGTYANTIAGQDVYVLDDTTPGFSNGDGMGNFYPDDAVALVDGSGTVLQFISWEGSTVSAVAGPAIGLTSTDAGLQTDSLQSDDGGSTYYAQGTANPGVIACYAPGTQIATPIGPRRVETLREGDLVSIEGGPAQPVKWVFNDVQRLDPRDQGSDPILIRPGALGPGRPARKLIVSAQHRILAGGQGQLAQAFDQEVFVPAKALLPLRGVGRYRALPVMHWVHLALSRHAVIFANDCLSESLFLGPMVLRGLSHRQRAALRQRFGPKPVGAALNGPLARPALSVGQSKRAMRQLSWAQHAQGAPNGPKGLSWVRGTRTPFGC
jgi:hypothetical protein